MRETEGSHQERCEKLYAQSKHDSHEVTKLSGRQFCWASGMERPAWWHGLWKLEAAHLHAGSGSGFRVDDRRAVICLCPLLHRLHVTCRKRIPYMTINGREFPTIDNANAIWIKSVWDPEYYDEEFIKLIWTGNPPEPEAPSTRWLREMNDNVGMMLR